MDPFLSKSLPPGAPSPPLPPVLKGPKYAGFNKAKPMWIWWTIHSEHCFFDRFHFWKHISAALHPKPWLPASSVALSNICFQPGARILPTLDPSHQLFDWFWLSLPVLNFLMILTFIFFFSINFSLTLSLKMVPEFYLLSIQLLNFFMDFEFLYPLSSPW